MFSARHQDVAYTKVLPNFSYGPKTTNSNLCTHLETYHEVEYLVACEEHSWTMQLPKKKRRDDAQKLMQSTLDGVAVPGMSSCFILLEGEYLIQYVAGAYNRPVFSQATFLQHLLIS